MILTEQLRRHRGKLVAFFVCGLVASLFIYSKWGELSREALIDYGERLPPGWFLGAFIVLPLLGFPVSLFLVLAGLRFGFWGGMAVAAVSVCCHHLLAYHLVHRWFRERFRARLERAGFSIPDLKGRRQIWFTALFAAIHGPPYIVKVYLLALTDVCFRIYFWVGAPVYIVFCAIPVGAGSSVVKIEPTWIYSFLFAMLALAVLSRWLAKRYGGAM